MVSRRLELSGQRFGRLRAIKFLPTTSRHPARWECQCDCGKRTSVPGHKLVIGHTTSCGCYHMERLVSDHTKHGKSKSVEYTTWISLKDRCTNAAIPGFHNYGGRGISVCARWRHSFSNFFEDMGPRPSPQHSIDRIDNDGDYTPENCRWATRKDQNDNTRVVKRFSLAGHLLTINQLAALSGLKRRVIYDRLRRGRSVHRAIIP